MTVGLPTTCWILTDGKVGTENACLGLAQILGMTPTLKRLKAQGLNTYLPEVIGQFLPASYLVKALDPFETSWPEVLITSGRSSVAVSLAIKRLSKNQTFTIHIQDPRLSPDHFDAVIAPYHDQISGKNVLSLTGSLHKVQKDICQKASQLFLQTLDLSPLSVAHKTFVGFLIGGSNGLYTFGHKEAQDLVTSLKQLAEQEKDVFFLITVSRRTSLEVFKYLQEACSSLPGYLWDNQGTNPYMAFLDLAHVLCVTSDSVAMVSEACSTGKPVYVIELPKHKNKPSKFDLLHQRLLDQNHTRRFQVPFEPYKPVVLDEKKITQRFIKTQFQQWVLEKRLP